MIVYPDTMRDLPGDVYQYNFRKGGGFWARAFWHWMPPWSIIGPHHRTNGPYIVDRVGLRDAWLARCATFWLGV